MAETEREITPKQAAAMFHPPVYPGTVWSWMRDGLLLNGERIRLKASRVGKRWYTTATAVETFKRQCEEAIR